MSQSFRPVKEIWNMHSSCFIEPEELIALLHDLAARAGTASDEHEYGDNTAAWLEDGNKVLNYMEADERFNAASFKDSMEEQGIVINKDDLDLPQKMRQPVKRQNPWNGENESWDCLAGSLLGSSSWPRSSGWSKALPSPK
ncbi:MAG: hypothetical protein WA172_15525 [Terriglobales bacterium]